MPRPPFRDIDVGLGIVNPSTRHPAQIAMVVADLEELAGPCFALGLGAGWSSIAAHCLGHARAGLAAAGRDPGEVDVACYIVFSVDEDGDAARAAARGLIAHYPMRIPDTVRFEYAGLDVGRMQSAQAGLRAASAEGRLGPAVDALDDDIVAALAVAGTPEECIEGLKPYAAAGLGTPVLYKVLGPDRLASIDLIAERIRPALAG